jgi:hypothetical protein
VRSERSEHSKISQTGFFAALRMTLARLYLRAAISLWRRVLRAVMRVFKWLYRAFKTGLKNLTPHLFPEGKGKLRRVK